MPRHCYITRRSAPEGYVAVTIGLAKLLWDQGKDVTIAGNNVNSFHIFKGWYLSCTINKEEYSRYMADSSKVHDLQTVVSNFMVYLEKGLGTYPVFYVKKEDVVMFGKGKHAAN